MSFSEELLKKLAVKFLLTHYKRTELEKGKEVVEKILKKHITEHNTLSAKIQGSKSTDKYSVEIDIPDSGEIKNVKCECIAYMKYFAPCKHLAALLLSYFDEDDRKKIIAAESIVPKHLKKESELSNAIDTLMNNAALQYFFPDVSTPIFDTNVTTKEPKKETSKQKPTAKAIPFPTDAAETAKPQKPKEKALQTISMEIKLEKLPDQWNLDRTSANWKDAIAFYKQMYWSSKSIEKSYDGKRFGYPFEKYSFKTFIEKSPKDNHIIVGCNCKDFKAIAPCKHIEALEVYVGEEFGYYYFKKFQDNTKEKNQLLATYGTRLGDEMASMFTIEFLPKTGEHKITGMPDGFLPKFSETDPKWKNILNNMPFKKNNRPAPINISVPEAEALMEGPYDTAILFNLHQMEKFDFWIDLFKITHQQNSKKTYKLNKLKTKQDLTILQNYLPLLHEFSRLVEAELIKKINEETSTVYYYANFQTKNLTKAQAEIVDSELRAVLRNIGKYLTNWKHLYYLPSEYKFSANNLRPCRFSTDAIKYGLTLKQTEHTVSLEAEFTRPSDGAVLAPFQFNKYLFWSNDVFYYLPEGYTEVSKYLEKGKLIVPKASKNEFIQKVVLPLSTKFNIDYGDVLKIDTIESKPEPRVYIGEANEKHLTLTPKWLYGSYEMENDGEENTQLELEKGVVNIKRKPEEEDKLIQHLRSLHPLFEHQNNGYFYLPVDEVMKKNWFLDMYAQLQEMDIAIFGMEKLKRFKYNTNKPNFDISTSSGLDWFDVRMNVSYGEQTVPLAALRKAILNKQQFVLLGDGSLGMMPEEWIKKFSTLMRMGNIKNDSLQVSKLHWTIIDQLHEEQIGEGPSLEEVRLKKQKLKEIENVGTVKIPKQVKAQLRDYQKSGFQWMEMLDEMGWGGCLADDMGLGKTLQTLTFLSRLKEKHKGETHLIVCPTSLIYNWQSEIEKFTPHLGYFIHYGTDRELNEQDMLEADIMITSYGMLRSDIEKLVDFSFGYIILDESQAIKNHLSQTAKAVQLIKARNRLILSGTPVQNNTFDLYSQFNFINPGLLGNMEFFKSEYANPIDKDNDKTKTEELRKLIYPFMLRRTKEQVAKDLPEKTETILWCEMEGKQRTIYNSFRDDFRNKILKKINEEGMGKAGMFILSGLTKLRQICDSPAILNEEEAFPNVSVKITELMREIEENSSNHKALVFSQFTSMLELIAKELTKRNIPFFYLDGSTKATERQKSVADFQSDESVKIFLISLKAGGVGLNLTSADYVYLVDPWWNPATEQQAIDRTHRIGQKKNVFAYKLICKDSIEEKILQLQQKKKALSADLISDENGFVKKLTKEDVAYLFS